ncbi:uncharacterized protein J3R85_013618 [Psidium guajava]|nr:uncharacterized protein J3R85_013618 [Psidium guajava]
MFTLCFLCIFCACISLVNDGESWEPKPWKVKRPETEVVLGNKDLVIPWGLASSSRHPGVACRENE